MFGKSVALLSYCIQFLFDLIQVGQILDSTLSIDAKLCRSTFPAHLSGSIVSKNQAPISSIAANLSIIQPCLLGANIGVPVDVGSIARLGFSNMRFE